MTDQAAKLDALLDQQEQALKIVVGKAMQAMNSSATVANVRNYEAARKALDAYKERQTAAESCERFRNLEQVAAWIISQGYLVSVRTVRNHADRPGFPKKQKDGSYLKPELEVYAASNWENPSRPPAGGEVKTGSKEDFTFEQVRKLRLANEITEGLYVLKSDAEQRAAAAAAYLKNDLANFGPKAVDRFVEITVDFFRATGIDTDNINLPAILPDLLEQYDRSLESWMDRYAKATSFAEIQE